ncbi:hypothetical protein [Mastigocoleus sp. MO_188.B34]|uniref:hypothetical protein n=1 Tax=Mastigocoleus sp. MO_188.B34 TaxID=3036635 RepID=UPI0026179AC7|nr:hypothetical protein [Mastigocoleus sp. MO_188.B34]MDJ0693935.1 hypothetical protein [Mastigocoleus sp. MO_188.B34]
MADITKNLNNVWCDLWKVFGTYGSWKSDIPKCKDIQARLLHFNNSHSNDPEHIDDVVQSLSRGFYLIKSGLEWCEPTAGHNSIDKLNATHKARGAQWRLVMTYGGFETFAKTLLTKKTKKGLSPNEFNQFTQKCQLNSYKPLYSPNKTKFKTLEKWLTIKSEREAILDFLSLNDGDTKIIQRWLIEKQNISSWVDALKLSKALRNATAHGALSATKVQQWGLRKPLLTLSENLGEVAVAGIQKLI